jgi:hypothetical protein
MAGPIGRASGIGRLFLDPIALSLPGNGQFWSVMQGAQCDKDDVIDRRGRVGGAVPTVVADNNGFLVGGCGYVFSGGSEGPTSEPRISSQ